MRLGFSTHHQMQWSSFLPQKCNDNTTVLVRLPFIIEILVESFMTWCDKKYCMCHERTALNKKKVMKEPGPDREAAVCVCGNIRLLVFTIGLLSMSTEGHYIRDIFSYFDNINLGNNFSFCFLGMLKFIYIYIYIYMHIVYCIYIYVCACLCTSTSSTLFMQRMWMVFLNVENL